jgi:hypothetical protein
MFDLPNEAIGACKRDLEGDAARINKTIQANKQFIEAAYKFIDRGEFEDLPGEDKRALYSTLGYVTVSIPRLEQRYEILLKQIEEENKK